MLAGVEWWKVTGAPVTVLLLRLLAGLQVLVDSCILGGVGGEDREVGSELPGVQEFGRGGEVQCCRWEWCVGTAERGLDHYCSALP